MAIDKSLISGNTDMLILKLLEKQVEKLLRGKREDITRLLRGIRWKTSLFLHR